MLKPNQTRIMIIIFLSVVILTFFIPRHHQIGRLESIDTLLYNGQYAIALDSLNHIDAKELSKGEKAYYSLLLTQARYKNYIVATSDSVINEAVDYYSQTDDQEKYARALIYQGCVNEELKNLEKAAFCYHKAERIANKKDLTNLAFAKMRLGYLYQSQYIGANTIAINKFKEALRLYRQINDKHYMILCLTEIGGLYRSSKDKKDSTLLNINEAIDLAKATPHEEYALFSAYTCRAQYYAYTVDDYIRAKQDALNAIASIDIDEIDHPRAHIAAAFAYLKLQQMDSCIHYLNNIPKITSCGDSILYYNLLSNIYFQKGDYTQAFSYYKRSFNIGDSALVSSLTHRLLSIEKHYDTKQAELKNEQLNSRLKNTWLTIAVIAAISFGLLSIALGYRTKLKDKEHESELLRSDLSTAISSLQQANASMNSYEENLTSASTTITRLNKEIDDARQLLNDREAERKTIEQKINRTEDRLAQLNDEILQTRQQLDDKEQERIAMNEQLAILETKKRQSDEIKSIIDGQIKVIHELMQSAYELDSKTFVKRFNTLMMLPADKEKSSYWQNLQSLVNDLYDNILIKAQEQAGGALRDDEVNFLALLCCGFSRVVIMSCMNYKHIVTISNKKNQIAKKLGIQSLDEYVMPIQKKRNEINRVAGKYNKDNAIQALE